jgi:hypothetical protein
MSKIPGLKLSESEVSQTIDLKELTGVNMSEFPAAKEAIAQAFIDKIVERTQDGKDVDGKDFAKKYSKAYKDSLAFDAFGKTNKVNMTLSGEMLGTIDVVESKGNKIKIGWSDAENNAKAFNHNSGDTVPKRQFFGVTDKELAEIKREFKPQIKDTDNDRVILAKLDKLAEKILK